MGSSCTAARRRMGPRLLGTLALLALIALLVLELVAITGEGIQWREKGVRGGGVKLGAGGRVAGVQPHSRLGLAGSVNHAIWRHHVPGTVNSPLSPSSQWLHRRMRHMSVWAEEDPVGSESKQDDLGGGDLWNEELDEFIGEKSPDDDSINMKKILDALEEKGGYFGELEKTVSEELGIDFLQNRKARTMLIDEEGVPLPVFKRALEAIFEAYDIDSDGILSFSEMSAMYAATNNEPMPQEFWEDTIEGVDSSKYGLTKKGFFEFFVLAATVDAMECISDLRALGFKDEFPEPVFEDEDFEQVVEVPPPQDDITISAELATMLSSVNAEAAASTDNYDKAAESDEEVDVEFLFGDDDDGDDDGPDYEESNMGEDGGIIQEAKFEDI